ncbi:hypothetical protein HY410_00945 [Candidatus Gottesmanbacteria bacterium]|nr:hypothetical protein [Candidatus Gottesmanbacteria bacterium]
MKILTLYILVSLGLFLYSYTQVDLNLTLSSISVWQTIQKSFQYIGFFRRDISSGIFLFLLTGLTILYVWSVNSAMSEKLFWKIVLVTATILLFSYPAFSYDIYNYMFTAKTVLVYHTSPYTIVPLQLTGVEPWLNFMRWTHLPSAYTPLWILMTLPPYLFGFGIFLLILWNMKLLIIGFYLLTTYMIGKILGEVDHEKRILGMTIFALNPLILIESVISPHNDIVMMGLALTAWYARSWLLLAASVGLKLMTGALFPVAALGWHRKLAFFAMIAGLVYVIWDREVLPWYWVWIMPFVALLPRSRTLFTLSLGVSIGLLLRYLPYLYLGNWDPPAPAAKLWLTVAPIFLSLLVVVGQRLDFWKAR